MGKSMLEWVRVGSALVRVWREWMGVRCGWLGGVVGEWVG